MNKIEEIGKELERGVVAIDPEIERILRESLLDLSKPYPDPQMLVSCDDLPMCTRGNVSMIIGLPGSRKSFLCTAIAGAYLNEGGFMNLGNPNGVGRLLWFDTEQADGHVARIGRRLHRIAEVSVDERCEKITISMLRGEKTDIRLKVVEAGIAYYRPDFVVIDGVADLISDPNNSEQSEDIVTSLSAWSKNYDCHILTVVHSNIGSEKARGHLGSTLFRKCESAILASADGDYTTCKWTKSRDMRPDDFSFSVIDGLPHSIQIEPKRIGRVSILKQVIAEAMPSLPSPISYSDLSNKIMSVAGVKIDAAKKKIATATKEGLIIKNKMGLYHLPTVDDKQDNLLDL